MKVKSFLLFLGRGRSGSSLCGGLIACHPNVIIAHQKEFKDFKFNNQSELFNMLIEASMQKQFIWKPLRALTIQKDKIEVIGTKKQGTLIKNISDFYKLNELKSKLDIPVKFINTYRNPFDNIATIYNESQRPKHIRLGLNMKNLDRAITYYFGGIKMTQAVLEREPTLNVKHEELVNYTRRTLLEICGFLKIPVTDKYLDLCESLVWINPRQTRESVKWTSENIKRVNKLKNQYEFLREYTWEN